MKKIAAFFDFCETLVTCQSANPYLHFLVREFPTPVRKLGLHFMERLSKYRLIQGVRKKKALTLLIRGLAQNDVESASQKYIDEFVVPRLDSKIENILRQHLESGHTVIIVSGGFIDYIQLLSERFSIAPGHVVANKLEFKNGKATGKWDSQDCIGLAKIYRLSEKINLNDFDLKQSFAYSDHASDIPLLAMVGNPRVVRTSANNVKWAQILAWDIVN